MTLESFPIEYSMTGLRISATTSRIMWIDSASRRLRWAGSEFGMERSGKERRFYAASPDKATWRFDSELAAPMRAIGAASRPAILRSGTRNKHLLVAQGRGAVGVIVGVLAELAKVGFFIERDRRRVVVAHLETERGPPVKPRVILARLEQGEADPAPGEARVDRDRINARRPGPFAQRDERVADDLAVDR